MNTGFRPVKWRKPVILSHCKTNMPGNFILRFSLIGLVFMGWSMTGMGNDGKPHPHFHLNRDMVRFFKDSLPSAIPEYARRPPFGPIVLTVCLFSCYLTEPPCTSNVV